MESKFGSVISRGFFLILITGPLFSSYFWINQRTDITHSQVTMPEWVPFWPILALPYLAVLLTPAIGIFFIRKEQLFRRFALSFIPAYGVVALIWIFVPTEMIRPEVPPETLYQPYRDLIAIDRPVCVLPCGHIVGPMLLTCFLVKENRKHLRWLISFLAIASVSIVGTWQHRPIDVLIGMGISTAVAALFLWKKKPHSA